MRMRNGLVAVVSLLAASAPLTTAQAVTGTELAAANSSQQADYLSRLMEAIAQSFQEKDGDAVRATCVRRWYRPSLRDLTNEDLLAIATSQPGKNSARLIEATMMKHCGRDKAEGSELLRRGSLGYLRFQESAESTLNLKAENLSQQELDTYSKLLKEYLSQQQLRRSP